MKLLNCLDCGDIVALRFKERTCVCGRSKGNYLEDGRQAVYSGPSRILGMLNGELRASVKAVHIAYEGPHYKWFVINDGDWIRKVD